MRRKEVIAGIQLFLAAMLYGSGFVAQKAGASLGPFTFSGIRMLVGALALALIIFVMRAAGKAKNFSPDVDILRDDGGSQGKPVSPVQKDDGISEVIKGGIVCGGFLVAAINLQQIGIYKATDAGKAGFITSLYIIFVPIIGIFVKKKVRPLVWVCVFTGAVGFYLLSVEGSITQFQFKDGDFYILISAVLLAGQILAIDHYADKCDGVALTLAQFIVVSAVSIVLMFAFEDPSLPEIANCIWPIIYGGAVVGGFGFTFQVLGQKYSKPGEASLILSLEAVFAALFGALIFKETMTAREIAGCAIIFVSVMLPQLKR